MEWFWQLVVEHASYAHWLIFSVMVLAGLNLPISEDILLILSGVLASSVVPENTWKLFLGVFLGIYISDAMMYWTGRLLGPKMLQWKWFARVIKPERYDRLQSYYGKYGFITIVIGRFIPFGVRNCLYLTAGMAKMSYVKFIFFDLFACFISNSTIFWLAYLCGKNYELLIDYVKTFNLIFFALFALAVIAFVWYKWSKRAVSKT